MDDLSLRVYLENGSDAMRGGWLELPVVPERLDAFMRGVVGVDDGGGYAVVDHEPGWFGDVLGSDLESFSVSSLNLAARCVAHARDLAVADSVDGDVFLDMLATAAESEDVRFPSGIAALAARAGDVAEFWTEYSLPDSWRAGNSSPDELYGAHVAYGLMGDDAYSSLSYCMDLERLGRDEASNAGVTPGALGFVSDHEPLAPSGPVPDGALDARWSAMVARASELAGMMSVAADRAAADGRRRMAPPLTFYRLRSDWEAWHGPDDGGWRSEDCSVWLAAVLLHDMGLEPSVVYAEADPEAMF